MLVITTTNITKSEEFAKAKANVAGLAATEVKAKDEVTKSGVYFTVSKDTVTVYTAEEVNLTLAFAEGLKTLGLSNPKTADNTPVDETDFFLTWADGYKRREVNRRAHEQVRTALGLKKPSARAEAVIKAVETRNADIIANMKASGISDEQIKRIMGR